MIWNEAQAEVIAAPAEARLVVDAGPGTGKTATAAGRIAALARQGVPPQHLWTISFSRAAVGEMRRRLLLLGEPGAALARVTTLDSLAWHLREGEEDGSVLEGHDRAIEETLLALRMRDPHMLRRIAAIRHFTIDEAQDLVGARALLVVELIAALPAQCGITILTDEAQAIYGFSASALASRFTADTVARHLLDESGSGFRLHRLVQVHRTGDRKLLHLFASARTRAMHAAPDPRRKLTRMRRGIAWQAHGRADMAPDDRTLILYRSRAEVLAAAQQYFQNKLPFRLRLSGLPVMLEPWIALTLSDFTGETLPRWKFEDLWTERGLPGNCEEAWRALAQATGEPVADRIALPRLLQTLRTSHPPSELCRFDPGSARGPVIGTIHASKGREMERVQLMMPREKTGRDDPDAEARVLFVAATRARQRLEIGKGMRLATRRLASGRVYTVDGDSAARIEIGRPGDFDWLATGTVSVSALLPGDALALSFDDDSALSLLHEGRRLAVGTSALMSDLREIRARLAGGEDYRAWGVRCGALAVLGLYTAAFDPAVEGKRLPLDCRRTGLMLVPAVTGFTRCHFHAV